MERIKVKIGDNDNPTYHKEIFVHISERDYRVLQEFDMDEYDSVWDRLCNTIDEQNNLPTDWFIDGIKFD